MRKAILLVASVVLSSAAPNAKAFMHPSVPLDRSGLEAVKAKVLSGEQPWKAGYDAMAADWTSAIDYGRRGAVAVVTRNPNSTSLTANWRPDMIAAYNQARMWWFTGNEAYAQKARDILVNWADTQTSFGGMEANLDLGDYAFRYAGAAEILRGTWPGWTQTDTDKVKHLFNDIYWPALGMDIQVLGPTNKGSLSLAAGAAIAAFSDDHAKMERVLYHLRNTPATGFINTLSNGEHGETGRDEGHSYNHILAMSFVAQVLWNQGIDAFSYADNRLLAMGEYYARENLLAPVPYVPMGTTDEYYITNWSSPGFLGESSAFNILRNAYVLRNGMSAPYLEAKLSAQPINADSFMYHKESDNSAPATPLAPATFPSSSLVGAGGFSDMDIGTATPAGSSSYSNGVWTVSGSGSEIWTHGADSFHYTYRQMTGDCTIITKVESVNAAHPNAKGGIMIRSDLNADPGSKIWVALRPDNTVETFMDGWTEVYGGSNWEAQAYGVPQIPYWLKIERVGEVITAYASPDGTSWATLVYGKFANMPTTVYAGLAVCSYSPLTAINTTTFSHVNMTGGNGGATVVPEAPDALLASPGQAVPLRWTASFGATSYNVKRATSSGGPYTTIATGVPNPSYVDTSAVPDTTYYYVVTASNGDGEGPASPEATATARRECVRLSTGGTPIADSNTGGAINAFDANCGSGWGVSPASPTGWIGYDFGAGNARIATAYDINATGGDFTYRPKDWQFQGSDDGSNWTTLDTRAGETFASMTYAPLRFHTNNTTAFRYYRLNVTANNGGAGLELSELTLLGWADDLSAVPAGLSATPVSSSQINLAWTAASGATSYDVLRASGPTGPFSTIATGVTAYSYSSLGLNPGATYYYAVRSASQYGTSANSTAVGATTSGFQKVVSIDFQGGSTSNGTPAVMGTAETAGVLSFANWNTAGGITGTLGSLKDHTGAATTASVTWSCNNIWSMPIAESSGNARMMKGYLDTSASSTTSVTVSGLPAAFTTGGYSVYVYRDGDNGANPTAGNYTIGGTTINSTDSASTNFSGTFIPANNSAGNYVLFTGLTQASFTLTATPTLSRAPINGIQIVASGTGDSAPPTSPMGLSATAASTTEINLTWIPVGGATGYNVKRSTSSGGPYTTIATGVTAAGYGDTGLNASTTYFYVVSATNAFGESGDSAAASATTQTIYSSSSITPYTQIDGGVSVQTADANVFAGQQVRFSPQAGSGGWWYWSGPNGINSSTREITLSNINSGMAGDYTVAYTNIYGLVSSRTHHIAVHPEPAAPAGLNATIVSASQINLVWSATASATSYSVKRATTSGGSYTIIASGLTGTSYSDTGLTNGVTYFYVVSATNGNGEGANSLEVSAAPSDLRVRLKFDETTGTTAADSSGNGRYGATVNGPAWTAGQLGNALDFASASSQYLTLPSGVMTGVNDFTISAWVKMTSLASWARLFDFGTGTTNYMFLAPQGPTANRMRFAIRTPSVSEQIIDSSVNTPVGAWVHVAVTLTGTTGRLYLNGVEAGSNTAMTLKPSSLGSTTQNYLGKSQWPDPYLNGTLDEFRIFGRALSAGEIAALPAILTAPAGLTATAGVAQVSLSWTAVSGAENYIVKRATTPGGPYTTVQTGVTATTFTDTGLTNGASYYYVVSATSLGGDSPDSAEASATPLAAPAIPVGLAATAGDSSVALNWSASSGAVSYKVKRATSPGGPYTTIATGLATTGYTDNAAPNGTLYYYVVSAVNTVAESANSPEASAMPLPPAPSAPGSLTATPGNATIALAWDSSAGADSYNVKRATNSGGPYSTIASGLTSTSHNDTGVSNGTAYYYVVSATNLGGESGSSPEASATPVTPPAAPTGLAATAGNASASLVWNAVAGASGYRLKRATTSGGPYAIIADSLTGTSFNDTGLTNGALYYYVVSAYNAGGDSADSAQTSAAPQAVPAAPAGLAATAASSSKINLIWNAGSGANSYTVKRSTTSGGPYAMLASGLTATTWPDSGLSGNTTYYYVVAAVSNGGESPASAEASATTTDLRVSLAFDESGGATAADSSGDGYNAALVNGPLFATGTVGNAVNLDGTNDHVTLPSGVVSGLADFTASVWVKPDTVTNWSRVFDFGTGTSMNMFLTPQNGATGKVRFAITTSSGAGEQKIDGQNALAAGTWSHLVVTWSGNTGILYVNGVEVGRNSAMTLNPSSLGTTTQNYLGRSQYPDPYFDGLIDDFRIYNRALSATEIANQTAAQMPVPASVTGLTATAGDTQVSLAWTAVPGANGYTVKRSITSGGPYTTVAENVTTTTLIDTGLTNGTIYYYVVSAKNAGGEGANSSQASAMPIPPPPAVPTPLAATADSANRINLTWSASSGATGYNVKRATVSGGPYTAVAAGIASTVFTDTGLAASTTYYYVVSAVNLGGESANSGESSATTQPGSSSLPSGWANGDIGSVGITGSAGYAGGTYTVTGSGADIWDTADEFQFVSRQIIGDCDIIARVLSVENTDPWAKAGVMIRESLNANSTHATMVVTPASGVSFQRRASTGGSSDHTTIVGITAPHWVRLVRSGNTFTAYRSADGAAWTTVGSQTITMASGVYVGLAVTGHNNTSLASATFDNLSIVTLPSPWASADIGAVGAAGASYYSSGTFTIDGSGADIWGSADEFNYVYQTASGDCQIVARVASVENTNAEAKVGLMIREGTAANARCAAVLLTPSSGVRFQRRTSTGGTTANTTASGVTAPRWLKLTRTGNSFRAYYSSNGTTWTQFGGNQSITMATTVSIGIAVSSRNDGVLCTGVLDNVTATP